MKKTICFLVYEGMELLDLAGAQSAFFTATQLQKDSYELLVVGFNAGSVVCESGVIVSATKALSDVTDCHTLIVPGGKGARSEKITPQQLQELASLMFLSTRVVSVCTGAYLIARAGLPAKTCVATHWAFLDDLATLFPLLDVDGEKIYIQDGKYWSSAGVTSGIDLTLKLIELDLNKDIAHQVAKYLVVYLKRSGSQKQYSDALNMQAPTTKRMETVNQWIKNNIGKEISVVELAKVVHLSERQCHRMFLKEVNTTPAQYIEKYRMQCASELLITTDKEIKVIAARVGYQTSNGFNRAFERNFSVTPTEYRKTFYTQTEDQ